MTGTNWGPTLAAEDAIASEYARCPGFLDLPRNLATLNGLMSSLWTLFENQAAERPDVAALIDETGSTTTYAQLIDQSRCVAAGLANIGVTKGDSIGVFFPNRSAWMVMWLATTRLGANVVGLNTRFRTAELDHLLAVANINVVLTPDDFLGIDPPSLFGSLEHRPTLIVDGDTDGFSSSATDLLPSKVLRWSSLLGPPDDRTGLAAAPVGTLDDLTIGFTTSGTTGFPKVACHTQRSTLHHARAIIEAFELNHDSVGLIPLPLCGTFGFISALPVLLSGGTVVLQEAWDPGAAARLIATHGVTFCNGSDIMHLDVVNHPDFVLPTTWTTGVFADFTNAGEECVRVASERTDGTLLLTGTYGSSEGFALMCRWPTSGSVSERATNGGPLIHEDYRVRACDPETGAELGHNEPGELHFTGANFIDHYIGNAEASAKAFTDDGWFKTGDLGFTRDATTFVYQARLGDSLRLRGFLCDPSEIEYHLEDHDIVERAQVVGANRPGVGDVAVAFVIPSASHTTTPHDDLEAVLKDYCRDGLANYKRPERIIVVENFPVTDGPNGVKIRKVDLRESAQALLTPLQET